MSSPNFIKSFPAAANAEPYSIAMASADGQVMPANGPTSPSIGTFDAQGAELKKMSDVIQGGWGEVKLGAVVTFGDRLTSNANAHAVPKGTGEASVIGTAMSDGDIGDIIPYLVNITTAS